MPEPVVPEPVEPEREPSAPEVPEWPEPLELLGLIELPDADELGVLDCPLPIEPEVPGPLVSEPPGFLSLPFIVPLFVEPLWSIEPLLLLEPLLFIEPLFIEPLLVEPLPIEPLPIEPLLIEPLEPLPPCAPDADWLGDVIEPLLSVPLCDCASAMPDAAPSASASAVCFQIVDLIEVLLLG